MPPPVIEWSTLPTFILFGSNPMRYLRSVLLLCGAFLSPLTFATVLENTLWRVELDPATLAIRVTPNGQPTIQASSGVAARAVSQLEQRDQQASWQWDDGAFRVSASLEQRDLALAVTARQAGEHVRELPEAPP